jgi:hypothetical protein
VQRCLHLGTWCRCDRRHSVTGTLRQSGRLSNRSTNGSALCRPEAMRGAMCEGREARGKRRKRPASLAAQL